MKKLSNYNFGAIYIMLAGVLWALDALLRADLTESISPSGIVFTEHVIGFLILSPFFFKSVKKFRSLDSFDWLIAIVLSLVSSVAGTLLFTKALSLSFAEFDFTTPVLLQKLQPLFVVVFANLMLKEKISSRLLSLIPIALISSYMVSFGSDFVDLKFEGKQLIYILSIGAALCWGLGTILSRRLLKKLTYTEATSLRFLISIPLSFIAMFVLNEKFNPITMELNELWRFVAIALTTGAGAVIVYYKGLIKTRANIATFAELTFPITSIFIAVSQLNPYGEPDTLKNSQILGIVLLLLSIVAITLENEAGNNKRKSS